MNKNHTKHYPRYFLKYLFYKKKFKQKCILNKGIIYVNIYVEQYTHSIFVHSNISV